MNTAPTSRPDESGWYEIRLHGHLGSQWSARFEGMTQTTGDGFTLLRGLVVDQAALYGLLMQVRDIGLPLASVSRVEPADAPRPPRHRDTSPTGA